MPPSIAGRQPRDGRLQRGDACRATVRPVPKLAAVASRGRGKTGGRPALLLIVLRGVTTGSILECPASVRQHLASLDVAALARLPAPLTLRRSTIGFLRRSAMS